MTTYRWLGDIGLVNRATLDGRVLAIGRTGDLHTHLKLDYFPKFPADNELTLLRCDPLPAPLISTLQQPHNVVGEVDTVTLYRTGRIVGSGTIDIPDDATWARRLLDGLDQPVGITVDGGQTETVDIHRRRLRDGFRRTTRTFTVHTGWRVRRVSLVEESDWTYPTPFIRLANALDRDNPATA